MTGSGIETVLPTFHIVSSYSSLANIYLFRLSRFSNMNKFARAVFLLPCLFSAAAYAGGCPVVAARALYFITNNDENSVVAVRVHPNGTLSDGSVTMTGGAGGAGATDMGEAAGPDPLFSQSVLALSNGVSRASC
jgi:hypothetical protein